MFKVAHYFSPHMISSLKPNASVIEEHTVMPFIKSQDITNLKEEILLYIAQAKDVDKDICPLIWWKQKDEHLPNWSREARKVFLV